MIKNDSNQDDLSKSFCKIPFEFVQLDAPPNNLLFPCCWLHKPLGSLNGGKSISDSWNSESAQEIRKSILDGTYKYCSKKDCPHINNGDLPKKEDVTDPYFQKIIQNQITILDQGPTTLHFNNDDSCNLSCPSCRTELRMIVDGEIFAQRKQTWDRTITHDVLKEAREINLTGSGDPFASKIYSQFLFELDGFKYPSLKINLFTNGQLFNEAAWDKMCAIQNNIQDVKVSIDAASNTTYDIVRRGGDFHQVLKNVTFLSTLKEKGFFRDLVLCFVVQSTNYKEMAKFSELALEIGNCQVHFQRIINWGTFSSDEFKIHEIYDPNHPEYQNFLHELKNPIFMNPMIDMGNLTSYLPTKSGKLTQRQSFYDN